MSALFERRHFTLLLALSFAWLLIAASWTILTRMEIAHPGLVGGFGRLEVYLAMSPLPGLLHSCCIAASLRKPIPSGRRRLFLIFSGTLSTLTTWVILIVGVSLSSIVRAKTAQLLGFLTVTSFVGAYAYYFLIRRLAIPDLSRRKAFQTSVFACISLGALLVPKELTVSAAPILWWFGFSYGLYRATFKKKRQHGRMKIRVRIRGKTPSTHE